MIKLTCKCGDIMLFTLYCSTDLLVTNKSFVIENTIYVYPRARVAAWRPSNGR